MQTKSKFLKTAILAALLGIAGAAAVTPASAHEYDRHGGYGRDHRGHERHDWRWGHRHFHRGWY